MADVLNDEKLLHAVNNVFRGVELLCERIGRYCNAGRPRPFTKAECVVQPIVHWPIGGTKIGFQNLLGTGFDLISDLRQGKKKYEELNSHFKKPFQILDEFMKSKSKHEKSIAALLKNGDNLTETVVTTVLAEHLLSKLAPGQSYTVDKNCRDKDDMCKCGCKAKINFGDTGIGHEEVWHGFVDIMFSSHDGIEPETAAVMQNIPLPESDTEPATKKYKQAPDQKESEPCSDKKEDSLDENSEDVGDTDDQTIAQAIVFSLLQKQRHPEFENFLIPTIVISSTKCKILMYDAENDILLRSKSFNIFVKQGSFEISEYCIIVLWMVLHYRIFSSNFNKNDFYMDLNKLKSGFMDRIPPECVEIYKSELKSCAASFPKFITNHEEMTTGFVDKLRYVDFGIGHLT